MLPLPRCSRPSSSRGTEGFSLTVPADTELRRLRLYVTAHEGTGTLTASLSDASAPTYVQDLGNNITQNLPGTYQIDYAADSAGKNLERELRTHPKGDDAVCERGHFRRLPHHTEAADRGSRRQQVQSLRSRSHAVRCRCSGSASTRAGDRPPALSDSEPSSFRASAMAATTL